MHGLITSVAMAGLSAVALPQSPLTTTFSNNNSGNIGGGLYFDLTVIVPITILGLDLNFSTLIYYFRTFARGARISRLRFRGVA